MNGTANESMPCEHGYIAMPNDSAVYDILNRFNVAYEPVHGYFSALICPIGVIMNILNIIVLSQPDMINPINILLTSIAICDTVVMTSNFMFVVHFILLAKKRCFPSDFNKIWASFALMHAHVSIIGHSTSLWISVAMANVRYLTVHGAEKHGQQVMSTTNRHAVIISILVLGSVCIAALPVFLSYGVMAIPIEYTISTCMSTLGLENNASTQLLAYMPASLAMINNDCVTLQAAFWTNGILFKMLPCILLTVFIALLLKMLSNVRKRRSRFGGNVGMGSTRGSNQSRSNPGDRTTKMLVALLAIFLITEIPQGVLALGSGIFTEEFRNQIYNPLGNLLDLLSLINSSSNFVILCTMSKRFREVFYSLFLPKPVYDRVTNNNISRHKHARRKATDESMYCKKLSITARSVKDGSIEMNTNCSTTPLPASPMLTTENVQKEEAEVVL